jgi:hypothetical protein
VSQLSSGPAGPQARPPASHARSRGGGQLAAGALRVPEITA